MSFVMNCGLYSKTGKRGLSQNKTMIQIQDMFENGKPDIVLKTVKGFNIWRTPYIILILENSLKFGIVVLVMLNKMLVLVFTLDFYSLYEPGS